MVLSEGTSEELSKKNAYIKNKISDLDDYPEASKEIWINNYKTDDEKTLQDTWQRQAKACAAIEDPRIRDKVYSDFLWLLTDFKGIAGGRITANLGVPGRAATTMFNCFVHTPADINYTDPDSINGIYDMLKAQAQTLKSEGGYGMNFSWIRPAGSYVNGIDGRTPGVLKFMELWDKSSEIITMGSEKIIGERKKNEKKKMRKGAQMGALNCWHPEIEDFIIAKQVEGRLSKFNISVGITDGFMNAVKNNENWNLRFPDVNCSEFKTKWNGNIKDWDNLQLPTIIYKTVKARDLWDKIMRSTYNRNDPGVLFLDISNKLNPLSYAETIQVSNPCQPGWATVLTKNGITTINDIKIGDIIWSGKQWAKIINKTYSGIKPVYAFRTRAGTFYGTEEHKIVCNGEKVEVRHANSIDISYLKEYYNEASTISFNNLNENELLFIMDGLIIGDGMMHKASNNLIVLLIGKNDKDYFNSYIKNMILKPRPGITDEAWEVKTSIKYLDKTNNRFVPNKYKFGNNKEKRLFLHGLYSANGSICGDRITLKATSFQIIEDVQIMLSSLGIASYYTINKEKNVKFSNGTYQCKQSYDLNIGTAAGRQKFNKLIGFIHQYKQKAAIASCNKRPGRCKNTYNIVEKEYIKKEKVYDITIDANEHTYWSGGLLVGNCGEISMSTGVCLLFSLNLVKYIYEDSHGNYQFDFSMFKKAIKIATRFADNINDISNTPLREYKISLKEKRRIGLGVLGLGSLHYILGIKFGSEKSLDLIDDIFKTKAETELLASAELGKEKGSFDLFDRNKYFNTYWWKTLPISKNIKKQIEDIGEMRNSHHSANAPTGNMSVYAELVSGGIEPVFDKQYSRWVIVPEAERAMLRKNGFEFPDIFKGEWFETENIKEQKIGTDSTLFGNFAGIEYQIDKNRGLTKKVDVIEYGWKFAQKNFSKEKLNNLIKNNVFVTANDLSVHDHINTLKVIAKYVNMNSSKTVNLPNDYSYDEFKNLYMNAYLNNIKGITSYRAGTMTAVLESKSNNKIITNRSAIKRPKTLAAETHKIKVDAGAGEIRNAYITVSFFENTKIPYEIFINAPIKEDKDRQIMDLAARTTSMMLRHHVPMKFIIEQLEKVDNQFLYSIPANIAKVLRKYNTDQDLLELSKETIEKDKIKMLNDIKEMNSNPIIKYGNGDNSKVVGLDNCPSCKLRTLRYQEGCKLCMNCSYSECS